MGTGAVVSRRSEAESGVAVQAVPEPENCHVAGFILRASARVRVQVSAGFVLGAGIKAKTMTNNLPILSVLYVGLVLKLSRLVKALSSSLYLIGQ